ncbi:MAG: helix-turn-helix domain-containing protein [Gemmatimonas sp.]
METKTRDVDVTGSRQRILAAALRIYGEHGFSGSTTRRIASEARVNEVTIFRQFGSKAALMAEAVLTPPAVPPLPLLPAHPGNPVTELHVWALSLLDWLRETRTVIRRSFAETTDHPEVAGRLHSHVEAWSATLKRYVAHLEDQGRITRSPDAEIASSMLIAALLTDGLGRIELPTVFAVSADESTARYVGAFLRLTNFTEANSQQVQ